MYIEKDLRPMKKADLIAICVEKLLPFDEKDSKDTIIKTILASQAAEVTEAPASVEPSAESEGLENPQDEAQSVIPESGTPSEKDRAAVAAKHRAVLASRRGQNQTTAYQLELARRRGERIRPLDKRAAMLLELKRRRKAAGR